jgi:hypothetical protein
MIRTPPARRFFTSLSESPLVTRLRRRLGGSLDEPAAAPPDAQLEPHSTETQALDLDTHDDLPEQPRPSITQLTDVPDYHLEPTTATERLVDAPAYEGTTSPPLVFTPTQLRSEYVESRLQDIEKSLPRPLVPTPVSSPPKDEGTSTAPYEPQQNCNECPVCLEDISTNKKAVMCNLCKSWYHRPCLHPSFLDKDITTVKKEFVILICQRCTAEKLHLLSYVPPNATKECSSTEIQCELLTPPDNTPITDMNTQTVPADFQETNEIQFVEEVQRHPSAPAMQQHPSIATPTSIKKSSSQYYVIHGIDDPCSNLYEFKFTYKHPQEACDHQYSSLEQCYKYFQVSRHDNALGERIRREDDPYRVMKLAKECPNRKSREEDIALMRDLVKAKVHQCRPFRDAMRAATAMNLKYIHSTYPSDNVFGSGLRYDEKDIPNSLPGQNVLGNIIAECAASLKPEDQYPLPDISFKIVDNVAIILQDGEQLPYGMRKRIAKAMPRRRSPIPDNEKQSPWNRHLYTSAPRSHGGVTIRQQQQGSFPAHHQRQTKPRPTQSTHSRPPANVTHICFHCGVPGHVMRDCRLRHIRVVCQHCNGEGHKKKYCPFGERTPMPTPNQLSSHCSFPPAYVDVQMPNDPHHGHAYERTVFESNVPVNHVSSAPPYVYRSELFPPLPTSNPPNF